MQHSFLTSSAVSLDPLPSPKPLYKMTSPVTDSMHIPSTLIHCILVFPFILEQRKCFLIDSFLF